MKLTALMLLCFSLFFSADATADSRGVQVVVKDTQGREVTLYKGSHALLIGASRYAAGWPSLHTVPGEISTVKTVLENHGFTVEVVTDPNSNELRQAFLNFVNRHGFDADNRLVFFFAGHGHTRQEGRRGYLVPVDAPDPLYDERGFFQKALDMDQVMTWARRIESRHALFLFDSCFSGTIFAARERPTIPPHISTATARPVRQFISAGDADQPVPARSVFAPSLVRALEGAADLNNDGYVTGTELGMYLHEQVLHYRTGQTPVYGKIRDPDLDQGDFVFQLASSGIITTPPAAQSTIRVTSNISGASVLLDGRSIGTAPLDSMELKPGVYTVRVEKDGYEPFQRRVTIAAGRMATVHALLSPVQPRSAHLWVDTTPADAHVRILNIVPPYTPGIELEPGSYHVEVSASGYKASKEWINLSVSEDRIVAVALERDIDLQQIELEIKRERELAAYGEVVCGDLSIAACIELANQQALDNAAINGSTAIMDSLVQINGFEFVRDTIESQLDTTILSHTILEQGFIGITSYFVRILAVIKGDIREKAPLSSIKTTQQAVPVSPPDPVSQPVKEQTRYTKLGQDGTELPDNATQAQGWLMTRDNETGLIWEVKTPENKDEKYRWDDAQSVFIAKLNQQRFGGFNDWRLPEIGELETLIKKGERPAIDTNFFPNTASSFWSSAYWSATSRAFGSSSTWLVHFLNGNVDYNDKFGSDYVRAVRAGQ